MTNKLIEEYLDVIDEVKIQRVKDHLSEEYLNEFVGTVIILGIATYKRYMSQAAKACKKVRFKEKTSCMRQYETKAIRAEIGTLKSNINKCNKEKKVSLCRAKVDKRIIRLEDKLKKLNLKIATYRLKKLTKK
jgi:hypothetical protein